MQKPLSYNATVVAREHVTGLLSIFRVAADAPPPAGWFVPGQYCVLGMNNEANPALGSVRRSMSLAGAPTAGPAEFYVRYVAKPESPNPLTHLLWHCEPGARVFMRPAAAGHFTIPDTIGHADPRKRICISAGTGLAPFVSMIRDELARDPSADLSKWAIIHGVSHSIDLGYRAELERAAERHGLHYVPTVSRPEAEGNWRGAVGRAEAQVSENRLEELAQRIGLSTGISPHNAVVYICGLRGTICDSICSLIDAGFVPDGRRLREALGVPAEVPTSIYFEQYDAEPILPVNTPEIIEPLRARMHAGLRRAGSTN